ncbi:hypothetical protein [Tritonibacter scottomollicae]|uniref:hypothetical protein n=1 Tax=Tritonibacter scottomollicae TaxID=483013 RepID=UPI003AA85713
MKLIDPMAGLKALVVEGVSADELGLEAEKLDSPLPAEEKIDVAEYFGSERLKEASLVVYSQLKHSTRHASTPYTASGIKPTLRGYAKRFIAASKSIGYSEACKKFRFSFVSNRPINHKILGAVAKCVEDPVNLTVADKKILKNLSGLPSCVATDFFRIVTLEGDVSDIWDQQAELCAESSHFLPDADHDVPVQLKDLIATRAAEDLEQRRSITKADIFKRLGSDEKQLLPAPSFVKLPDRLVERTSFRDALSDLLATHASKCVVHAGGGLGKSTFAAFIQEHTGSDIRVVLYDCFGNGDYRNPRLSRHKPSIALVQISNELACSELCYPLVPSTKASKEHYFQAFHYRLDQAIRTHRKKHPKGSIWVLIDAADNAQMAALEFGDGRSFAADLVPEVPPEGVKFVFLCRTERRDLLSLPSEIKQIGLDGFSEGETAAHIHNFFPDAALEDVSELHRLSSGDPRVQATALLENGTLQEILRRLGPTPKSSDDMLATLLEGKIDTLLATHPSVARGQVEKICESLSTLRPRVPIDVVAKMADVSESAVRSFVSDLGRPLLTVGDAVQFVDEPAEGWFRKRFKPTQQGFQAYYFRLKQFEKHSAYVSTCLPQLALEAGLFDELVTLGLSSEDVFGSSEFEIKEIALARQTFALKACLRQKKWYEASKLSFLAATTLAGSERREALIRKNPDIAGLALNSEQIEEIAHRRLSDTGWQGSHNVYEASLLSGKPDMVGEARSRLRMSYEWLDTALNSQRDEDHFERVSVSDIAEIAWTHLNISGVRKSFQRLSCWTPREVVFKASRLVTARLLEHGRSEELNELCRQAVNDFCVAMALMVEAHKFGVAPPSGLAASFSKLLASKRLNFKEYGKGHYDERVVDSVSRVAELAVLDGSLTPQEGAAFLERHLPKKNNYSISEDHGVARDRLLRAHVLKATLLGTEIEMHELAEDGVAKELQDPKASHLSREARIFRHRVGTLLPWHVLRTKIVHGEIKEGQFEEQLRKVVEQSGKSERLEYSEHVSHTKSEIAHLRFEIDLIARKKFGSCHDVFWSWLSADFSGIRPSVLSSVVRVASQNKEHVPYLGDLIHRALEYSKRANEQAETIVEELVELSRSALAYSSDEAIAIYDLALETADLLGEENVSRWQCISLIGDASKDVDAHDPQLAYKFGRAAELTWFHVARDKYFPWEHSIKALVGISPAASFSVFARWADRKFGHRTRIMGTAVNEAMKLGLLSADEALVFQSMQVKMSIEQVVKGYYQDTTSDFEKSLKYLIKYTDMLGESRRSFETLLELSKEKRVSKALQQSLNRRLEESRAAHIDNNNSSLSNNFASADAHVWEYHCHDLTFCSSSEIKTLQDRIKKFALVSYGDGWFEQCLRRIKPGREVQFINAVMSLDDVGLYSRSRWLESFLNKWPNSLAVSRVLKKMALRVAAENCSEVLRPIYWVEDAPSTRLTRVGGCTEKEFFSIALEARSETVEEESSEQLFSVAGSLSAVLSAEEARSVLNFVLDLVSENIPEEIGDGDWRDEFLVSESQQLSIAGYLWQTLCDAQPRDRWFASHAVRGLLELGCHDVLKELVGLDDGMPADQAFFHPSFVPYHLFGRLHLAIGLSRGVLALGSAPEFVTTYLQRITFEAEPHVLIRAIASKALAKICEAEDRDDMVALSDVNAPEKPLEIALSYKRKRASRGRAKDRGFEEKRFLFDYEMRKDIGRLGDVFALTESETEIAIEQTIQSIWGGEFTGRYDQDERGKADLYRDQRSGRDRRKGEAFDTLSEYLGFNGMMITAGRLLSTGIVGQEPNASKNEFDDWMEYRGLGRKNGFWKSDVRTRQPVLTSYKELPKIDKKHWKWSISPQDLTDALIADPGKIVLWGSWKQATDGRIQRTRVHSALVRSELASSLASSLQLQSELSGFSIPTHLRDRYFKRSSTYTLEELADWSGAIEGIDDEDPWAADLGSDLPELDQNFCLGLGLEFCEETQSWNADAAGDGRFSVRREVWTAPQEYDREGDSGQRIVASNSVLDRVVSDRQRSVVFEVSIKREFPTRTSSYKDEKENEIYYPDPYVRYYIYDAAGKIRAL